ncbi:MAG: DUF222 domain-containing protein [Candidatus Nanopelagicales bacterium]
MGLSAMAAGELPSMGLVAGERPAADVEVLCSAVAIAEFEVARRMHAASVCGSLPLTGAGALPLARGWSAGWAKRLASAGEFAARWPQVGVVWAAGVITSEHAQAVARHAEALTEAEMGAVLDELAPLWGRLSPRAVGMFVERVIRMLHPPADPEPDERDAYECRSLGFAVTGDSVLLSGVLPRLEGEALIGAIDGFADRLRSQADHVPASARRADALMALVNAAHASGALPCRGGLPVSVSVTMDTTAAGDVVCSTSRGHTLTQAEVRFASCDALVTPIVLDTWGHGPRPEPGTHEPVAGVSGTAGQRSDQRGGPEGDDLDSGVPQMDGWSPAQRIAALAATLLGIRMPLAVGRTARTAMSAQRRALAARDQGCIIPGCGILAEACQTHHVHEWAQGGESDLPNLALLCWAHHRQVDLGMWTITPVPPGVPPVQVPDPGTPPGVPWPANNGAPWIVTRTARTRWRL